jgi:hypothetical protein
MRFRLRFLLQEIDLLGSELFIGRSQECQITIEDPLLSRRHAKLRLAVDQAFISDLGSRNGVRVNGKPILGEVPLHSGDRLRLGTQELVFSIVDEREKKMRQTGNMQICRACGLAFPDAVPRCPHCGTSSARPDDTMTGLVVGDVGHWSLQMIGEVVERAIRAGREDDANRVLQRTAHEMEATLHAGERVEPSQLSMFCTHALGLAVLTRRLEWAEWSLTSHRNLGYLPTHSVTDELLRLLEASVDGYRELLEAFVVWAEAHAGGPQPPVVRLREALSKV